MAVKSAKKKPQNPYLLWEKMKADFELEDDEMPEYLKTDIEAWNAAQEKEPLTETSPLPINRPLNRSLQAEGVLQALMVQDYPERPMVARKCKACHEVFRTSYKSNAYCSDLCRRDGLKSFGIDWHHEYNTKSEIDEWAGRIPAYTIPPAALRVMKYLVLEAEELRGEPLEPWIPKHAVRMNGASVELVHAEPLNPSQSDDSSIDVSVQPSLKERLAALRSRTGLGN